MKIKMLLKTCRIIWKMKSRIDDLQTETIALIDTNEKLKNDKIRLQHNLISQGEKYENEMNKLLDIKAEYYKIIRKVSLERNPDTLSEQIDFNRFALKVRDYLNKIKYKPGTNEAIDEIVNVTQRTLTTLAIFHYYNEDEKIIWYCD